MTLDFIENYRQNIFVLHITYVDKSTSRKYAKTINVHCVCNKAFVKNIKLKRGVLHTPPLRTPLVYALLALEL